MRNAPEQTSNAWYQIFLKSVFEELELCQQKPLSVLCNEQLHVRNFSQTYCQPQERPKHLRSRIEMYLHVEHLHALFHVEQLDVGAQPAGDGQQALPSDLQGQQVHL